MAIAHAVLWFSQYAEDGVEGNSRCLEIDDELFRLPVGFQADYGIPERVGTGGVEHVVIGDSCEQVLALPDEVNIRGVATRHGRSSEFFSEFQRDLGMNGMFLTPGELTHWHWSIKVCTHCCGLIGIT